MSTCPERLPNDNPSPPAWHDAALDDCYFCSEEAVNECCDCYKQICYECSVVAWDQDQSLGAVLRCDEDDERKPDLKLKISREQAVEMLFGAYRHITVDETLPFEILARCQTEIHSLIFDVRYGRAA